MSLQKTHHVDKGYAATTTGQKEARFLADQLVDRVMLRNMGSGFRDVLITFQTPLIVTSRNDEGIAIAENFTNPKAAKRENYPQGAFGYSQMEDLVLKLNRPMVLLSFYMKMHRDSRFWNMVSQKEKRVLAYLDGELVLNATVSTFNNIWIQVIPQNNLMIDKLVLPPETDIDNLELGSDTIGEEEFIRE